MAVPAMRRERPSRLAIAGLASTLLGITEVCALAGTRPTPVSPHLPADARPSLAFVRLASWTGAQGASPQAKGIVAMLAAMLLGAGFVALASEAWRGRLPVRIVVVLAVGMHALAVALPVLGSSDVFIYGLYGRIVAIHHVNPFTTVPAAFHADPLFAYVDRQWSHTPPVYGPAFLGLAAAIASICRTPGAIVEAFKVVSGVGSLATLFVTLRLVRRFDDRRTAFAAVVVGANPAIVFVAVAGGHVDVLVGLAIALSLLLLTPTGSRVPDGRRTSAAVAMLAAAALVKFVAVVPLVLVVAADTARRPRGARLRAFVGHAAIGVAIGVVGYLPFAQLHDPTFGLAYLFPFGSLVAPMFFLNNVVVDAVASTLGSNASFAAGAVVRLSFAAAFATAFVTLVRGVVARAGRDAAAGIASDAASWGWALVLVTLSFQWLYPWYVAWFAPLAWCMPRRLRSVAVGLSAVLPLATILVHGTASPVIASGLSRFCFYVIAPALLVVLVRLLGDLRAETRSADRAVLRPRPTET